MKPDKRLRLIATAVSFTFMMAGSLAAGYLIGRYLDGWFRGQGLCTALFILLGVVSGFYSLYRVIGKKGQ